MANSLRCALMSYLSYKSPEFITDAMNNSFFMGILGNCSLTLRHDQSSDVRMLCLKPRHVQNSYQGKAIFAIRGTAMGNVQHMKIVYKKILMQWMLLLIYLLVY